MINTLVLYKRETDDIVKKMEIAVLKMINKSPKNKNNGLVYMMNE